MDTKTISKQAKKAVAIGLCASLVGGVAAPVLNTSHVAYAAVAGKPSPNSTHSSFIQFKDPVLKKRIQQQMYIQRLIDWSDQDITEEDALKVKELDLDKSIDGSVISLDGIENFKNLTKLSLAFNQISDITPLAGLTNLTKLSLAFNQISDITPLAGLTNLTSLSIESNGVSDVAPLQSLTNLTKLNLDKNHISDITPLKALTNLTTLDLAYNVYNKISDLSPLAGLTKLTSLSLDDNQISDVAPLQSLTNLTKLSLAFNQISDITLLKGLTNLTDLSLDNNQISDVAPLQSLTNLTTLSLDRNKISDITPLKGLTNLTSLSLKSNQIQNLECLNALKSKIDATTQTINLQPTATTVDLKKEVKGFGNVKFDLPGDGSNGILTYKGSIKTWALANEKNKNHEYSATINIDFSNAPKSSETQTEDVSLTLAALLKDADNIKACDNYKNADGKLKQAYDTAIKDGKAIYDKLSSTPEQVKQAVKQIQAALDKLNGDKKAQAIKEQLSNATQQISSLQGELEKAKQQGTADASTIATLTGKVSDLTQQLEKLKGDKTLSEQQKQDEIDKLNGQIAELGKQIDQLTKEKQSLQEQLNTATSNVQKLSGELEKAKQQGTADAATIANLTGQVSTLTQQLEKLKSDKTLSEQEKQAEIDKLNGKIAELEKKVQMCTAQSFGGSIVAPLVNEKPTFDIEKYKREHNYMLSGIATHTYQTTPDTFTSDVHAALQQLAPMAASTNAAAQATAQRTDESERAQAEQKANTSSKQDADKTNLDQSKFPKTGDNSLLTLLSTFASALVLVLGCFARKKQSCNINKK